jgi:hypothetical protein
MRATFSSNTGGRARFVRALLVALTLLALGAVSAGAGTSTDPTRCPLKPSSTIPSGEAWTFSANGSPTSPHPGVTSTYTHGRGTWANGRGTGTICTEAGGAGHAAGKLVLTVAGSATISTEITRLGHLGVGLVLHMTVGASEVPACPKGERGTLTLFASYFQGHFDSAQLRFAGPCRSYDYRFAGPRLLVLIARNGGAVR